MIRLLIVDDSALMRRLLTGIFADQPDFVAETARDGAEALARLHVFRPDVVTLDVQMPGMDGLATLDRIMLERPVPVVMLSTLAGAGTETTLEALALGAVDVVAKPAGPVSLEMDALAPVLVAKVRAAAAARVPSTRRLSERVRLRAARAGIPRAGTAARPPRPLPAGHGLVLIGTSTGGPSALEAVLGGLPGDLPWPVLIAQHMPESFTGPLARRLDRLCAMGVEEVSGPVPLEAGRAYLGCGNADMLVARRAAGLVAMAAPEDPARRWHPSFDRLVESALDHVEPARLLGVVMTGMGDDGAAQLARLHALGGTTIAEAEESAVVWGMPGALVRAGGAGQVVPLSRIAAAIAARVAR